MLRSESNNKYYIKNRDKILKREKIECSKCKMMITRACIPRHIKTKKCNYIFNLLNKNVK